MGPRRGLPDTESAPGYHARMKRKPGDAEELLLGRPLPSSSPDAPRQRSEAATSTPGTELDTLPQTPFGRRNGRASDVASRHGEHEEAHGDDKHPEL